MFSRRAALRALASGGVLGVSGCASVVRRFGARRRAPPNDSYPPPTTQAGKGTTTITSGDDPETTSTTTSEYRVSTPTGYLTDAPIPADPNEFRYATMGPADAEVVTLYGSWKCPYTREFVVQNLPDLARSYVEPGRVAIRFRALAYQDGQPYLGPDAPRAAWAGLAVWAHDARSYWPYFATVFQNQPPERDEWATLDTLQLFLRTAGVDNRNAIIEDVLDAERDELVRETSDAAAQRDIRTIPRLAYDGEVVAPNFDLGAARDLLERAAEDGTTSTTSATPTNATTTNATNATNVTNSTGTMGTTGTTGTTSTRR